MQKVKVLPGSAPHRLDKVAKEKTPFSSRRVSASLLVFALWYPMYRPAVIVSIVILAFLASAIVVDARNVHFKPINQKASLAHVDRYLDAASHKLDSHNRRVLPNVASSRTASVAGFESAGSEHDRALLDVYVGASTLIPSLIATK